MRATSPVFMTALLALISFNSRAAAPAAGDVKRGCDRCANWLIEQYDKGSKAYGKGDDRKNIMTNALIVSGLCKHPRDYKESSGPFVSEPVKFLLSKIKKDGSIKDAKDCECECLALIVAALEATENEAHKDALEKCKAHLETNFKECTAKCDKENAWTKQDQVNSLTLEHPALIAALHNAKAALKAGKKEVGLEGKPVAWAPALAEALLKQQKPNGSFGDDITTNALVLNILDLCYKGLKLP